MATLALIVLGFASFGGAASQSLRPQVIPIAFALKMNTLTSAKQIMRELDVDNQTLTQTTLPSTDPFERKAVLQPNPAGCIPEKTVVSLKSENKMETIYPTCTRVERCGGCCSHDLLSCQPSETETIYYEVIVTEYINGPRPIYKGKRIIPIEKHNRCKCDCRIRKSDCKAYEVYIPSECQCACANEDAKLKCDHDESNKKYWDYDKCSCECHKVLQCNTGYTFNKHTCSCELQRIRSTYPNRINPNKKYEYSTDST